VNDWIPLPAEEDVEQGGRITGVAIGVVTDNQDPDALGRVRVRFPWRGTPDESHWARIAVPMAGPDRGTWFLPEVDDEVLVAFERGDISHPYIVGALWNGKDVPPATNSGGSNDIRKIRSRAGHELVFDDGPDKGVELRTADGKTVTMMGAKLLIEDGKGSSITIEDGKITVTASSSLSLEAPDISVKASGRLALEGGGLVEVKGGLIKLN
jgi:uncharacterized protein involved in type VI secretion and phage assembly